MFLLSLSTAFAFSIEQNYEHPDLAPLMALYVSFNLENENLSGWEDAAIGLNEDPCDGSWYGIDCDSITNRVIGIELFFGLIDGTIAPEIGDITYLKTIDFSANQCAGPWVLNCYQEVLCGSLYGNIPPEMGNLIHLEHINLSYTELTGYIPPEIGNLTNLTFLDLASSLFTGSIPAFLGDLTELEHLDLSCNNLTGGCYLPNLCNLADIDYLDFSLNGFFDNGNDFSDYCTILFAEGEHEAFCGTIGCTNPMSCNYDIDALLDDGSCLFEALCNTDPCLGDTYINDSADPCNCILVETAVLGLCL